MMVNVVGKYTVPSQWESSHWKSTIGRLEKCWFNSNGRFPGHCRSMGFVAVAEAVFEVGSAAEGGGFTRANRNTGPIRLEVDFLLVRKFLGNVQRHVFTP